MKINWILYIGLCCCIIACRTEQITTTEENLEWSAYNGGLSNNKYAPIDQINKENIQNLEVAWSYQVRPEERSWDIKCNPLMVNGKLYAITASKNLVALDATNGQEKWYMDFKTIDSTGRQASARGVHYWEKGEDKRIFYVYSKYLYAINAETGTLINSFGENGRVSFDTGLGIPPAMMVRLTTPGVIFKDLLIVGSFVSERLPAAPGHIRAFNVITGELEWIFHTIPKPGEYGYDTWPSDAHEYIGGANNWGGMSLDEERGIVYVPTGSPTYDFYGANRKGQNLFANCLLALNASTGERIWHFQMIHHDLWDRDIPCAPNLLTIQHNGAMVDVVVQPTKQGFLFMFNRETGEPIYDIEEVPVPPSTMEGEEAWPTQPIPSNPPPYTRQEFTLDQITDIRPEAEAFVKKEVTKYKTAMFTPPDTIGVILQPDFSGGAGWGGAAVDEATGTLVLNAIDAPGLLTLFDQEFALREARAEGSKLYQVHCASCHGKNLEGGHYYPSLVGVEHKYSKGSIERLVRRGVGLMPAMDHIPEEEVEAIAAFLTGTDSKNLQTKSQPKTAYGKKLSKYSHYGYELFEDDMGYPAIKPPWTTLTAYDMNKGTIKWQKTLGAYEELTEMGIPPTGADTRGGPIITAGGLVFLASTNDNLLKAYDIENGEILWQYKLPGQGAATPCTYLWNGVQYLVIAVTDHEDEGFKGMYMAFKVENLISEKK